MDKKKIQFKRDAKKNIHVLKHALLSGKKNDTFLSILLSGY